MKLLSHTGAAQKGRPPAETLAAPCGYRDSRGGRTRIRLALGGTICGGFLGSFAGALFGIVYGAWAADLSRGLDGALIGGAVVAVLGLIYGLGCARKGEPA